MEAQYFNAPIAKTSNDPFKKQIQQVVIEFSEAKSAYDVYCKLKAEVKWLEILNETKRNRPSLTREE